MTFYFHRPSGSLELINSLFFFLRTMSKRSFKTSYSEQQQKKVQTTSNTFRVESNERYEGSFPIYKQPQELTCYSIDHKRHVWFDDREMVI